MTYAKVDSELRDYRMVFHNIALEACELLEQSDHQLSRVRVQLYS
jgi:hypothetical protein